MRCFWKAAIATLSLVASLGAQPEKDSGLPEARKLDRQIEAFKDLPDEGKAEALHKIAMQVRQQPLRYELPLAYNLAIDGEEAASQQATQEIADVLSDALRKLGTRPEDRGCYQKLAELVHSAHVRTNCRDPRLTVVLKQLDQEDREAEASNFSLPDLQGRTWSLKELHGKVVLVNFWETWCPPCRRELPDLESAYRRFRSQGLIVLSITYEERQTVTRFSNESPVSFPTLLDPHRTTEKVFRVSGFPKNVVFDRNGHIVACWNDRPSYERLIQMMQAAGLTQ